MAAALHAPRSDLTPSAHPNLYPKSLMADLDLRDNRYPSVSSSNSRRNPRQNPMSLDHPDQATRDRSIDNAAASYRRSSDNPSERPLSDRQLSSSSQDQLSGWSSPGMLSVPAPSPEPPRGSLSYALPPDTTRRVRERYSLGETGEVQPPAGSAETRQTAVDSNNQPSRSRSGTPQPTRRPSNSQDRPPSLLPSSPRHPSLPAAGIGSSPPSGTSSGQFPPIMPLSASPNYAPPVAPRNRAYPQQPTYVTPTNSMSPVNPVYSLQSPPPPPPEDVCLECTMRDQEMADVDVTSPGVWERASDAAFEELKGRELEDEANGIVSNDPKRPRIRGGRLTEPNLRLWLSINPKEPAARLQTVNKYVKAQRALLKEEAHARAQALREAKQLDSIVRDTFTQWRNSVHDLGSHVSVADTEGGVRIKPPQSPGGNQAHHRSHSREITLLENGLIKEHVDVRKEDQRRRKEERARKSSRSSAVEVTSIISANSNGRHTDNGASLKPYSRYSQSSSARPISILTAPLERPELPRAYSQASLSDVHSLGSGSPRRRFFGFRNLSAGWRSQDSLAPSAMTGGSMMDMHVALQRESNRSTRYFSGSPVDLNSPRRSQIWPPAESFDTSISTTKGKSETGKKKKGLAKIWQMVTGHKGDNSNAANSDGYQNREKIDDDLPLPPPPSLLYLVDGGPPELAAAGGRQNSTPSLSSTPPKFGLISPGMSPPTAPSSALPSPVSSRPPGPGLDTIEIRNTPGGRFDEIDDLRQENDGLPRKTETTKTIYPVISVPDMRQQNGARSPSPLPPLPSPGLNQLLSISLASREKSLPPIPPGEEPVTPRRGADRPRTVYTYDPRPLPPGTGPAHDFLPPNAQFRFSDLRRQSFGGTSSRPNLPYQTIPINGTYDPRRSFSPRYDEFGSSRMSLARLNNALELPATRNSPVPSSKDTKRKSKFGLSSLLGKKHHKSQDHQHEKSAYVFPTSPDGPDEWNINYATPNPRYSEFSMTGPGQFNPRISVTSRKALEELVSQDSEFVAYRYPSSDQRLDFLR